MKLILASLVLFRKVRMKLASEDIKNGAAANASVCFLFEAAQIVFF